MKKFFTFTIFLTLVFVLGMLTTSVVHSLEIKTPEFYYLEAEVLSQDNNATTFCSDKGNFMVDRADINPDNVYLLTMASNFTSTTKDDEVVVIWADCN